MTVKKFTTKRTLVSLTQKEEDYLIKLQEMKSTTASEIVRQAIRCMYEKEVNNGL